MNLLCFVVPLYDGVLMINNDTDVNILLTPDSSICADGIKIVSKEAPSPRGWQTKSPAPGVGRGV